MDIDVEYRKLTKETVTLDDLKPKGRVGGYPVHVPRWYTRLFEMLPGLLTWFFILLPFIAAIFNITEVVVAYVSFLTIYWAYRGIQFLYGLVEGYKRWKRDESTDWVGKIKSTGKPIPSFVYICPIVKEGLEIIRPSVDMFAKQDIGAEKISVVFALEERFKDISIPNCEQLIKEYKDKFREIYFFVHPMGIEGEVIGVKGANINWSTRQFVEIVKARKESLSDYLLITCDSDMRPHEKYLSAITYKYLTSEKPLRTFYSTAIHTFNNNIWRVPPINRVAASSLTLALFHAWVTRKKDRETFSSYVVNLQTVDEVEYWDPTVGIDDTTFYWNALVKYNGDFRGEEVYIPTYSDAVENETFIKSHRSLYMQQLRWGWGIIVIPITFSRLYRNALLTFFDRMSLIWRLVESQLLYLTVVYTITLAIPILNFVSPEYQYSSASYRLPKAMSYILTALMFLNIPVYYIRSKVTPKPAGWSKGRWVLDFFETGLITINMLTFGFIPRVQAQTEMLFNRFRNKYYATEKVAIQKQ